MTDLHDEGLDVVRSSIIRYGSPTQADLLRRAEKAEAERDEALRGVEDMLTLRQQIAAADALADEAERCDSIHDSFKALRRAALCRAVEAYRGARKEGGGD